MKLKIDAYGKEYKYISSAKNKFIPTKNKSNVNREIISLKERLESIGFVRVNLDNSKIHSRTYIKVIDASGRFVIAETYLKNRNNTTNNQQLENHSVSPVGFANCFKVFSSFSSALAHPAQSPSRRYSLALL